MWFVGAPVTFDGLLDEAVSHDVVPTRPADRHLTLVYLGRVELDDARGVWRDLPHLSLPEHARPLGWERFGRRAIALSLVDEDDRLRTAAQVCADVAAVRLAQLPRPSRFRPHVTLARVRKGASPPTPAALRAWPVPPEPLSLGPAALFRLRGPSAADRYEVVAQQPRDAPSGPG